MKTGRFFVTFVLVLITVLVCNCHGRRQPKAVVSEGNTALTHAMIVGNDLTRRHQMRVQVQEPNGVAVPQRLRTETLAHDYNWKRLSLTERQEIKGKLNDYIASLSRALEIDSQKGVYITHRDSVLRWRENALSYQRSLEDFEKIVGETFDPKRSGEIQPVYSRSYEASTSS